MPNQISEITVFVSSPSDVSEYRHSIVQVCEEISNDLGIHGGFVLRPLMWEKDVPSGRRDRAQDLINEKIAEYDIYLGLMKERFGAPTGDFGSGTEEEFSIALNRHKLSGLPKIQFYFSAEQVDIDSVDTEQLAKVKDFKSQVGEAGVVYKSFKDEAELRLRVRASLHSVIFDELEAFRRPGSTELEELNEQLEVKKPYESLPNLSELVRTNRSVAKYVLFNEATYYMDDTHRVIREMGDRAEKLTKIMNRSVATVEREGGRAKPNENKVIRSAERMFAELSDFITWLSQSVGEIDRSLDEGLNLFQRAVFISKSIGGEEKELETSLATTRETAKSLTELRDTVLQSASGVMSLKDIGGDFVPAAEAYSAVARDLADSFDRAIDTMHSFEETLG